MSYSALTSQTEQPICPACRKPIEDGEPIILALLTTLDFLPEGLEFGEEDQKWCTSMEYTEETIYHRRCHGGPR